MRLAVQAAGPRVETYFDRPWADAPRASKLVVIGEAGLDRAAIEAAIRG
jgi:cobalamin biosynthesis protein CobW